jgi:peptide/nickel transport system permease protein
VALPAFWIGVIFVYLFAVQSSVFPATGYVPFDVSPQDWALSLALPVLTLAVGGAAFIARQTRASMLEALQQEHIRTLRATATPTWKILYVHALRYASLPIVAGIALQFIGLFGGSVIAEQLFAMPGLGQAVQTSVSTHDAPAVQGVVVIATVVVVAVNLVLELATKFLDPKLRAS